MRQITLTVSQNVLVSHINEHSCHSMRLKCPPRASTLISDGHASINNVPVKVQTSLHQASSIFVGRRCHEYLSHAHFAV